MPVHSQVRTILFDVGNTLAFIDLPRIAQILAGAGFHRTIFELSLAEARARRILYGAALSRDPGTDASRWLMYLGELLLRIAGPTDLEELRTMLSDVHRRENLWRYVPHGTRETLDELRREGYRLGVISNADGRVEQLLQELDLHHRFDVIIDSHHAGFEKPDPAIFAAALGRLGIEPSSAVYVGDFYAVDVVGARAAGVEAILLDPLGVTEEPDCLVIRSLEELREILGMHR